MTEAGILVVDFDGVVCDALDECALVTWLGLHGVDPNIPVSSYLRAVPDRFAQKFAAVRNFARTLDDFAVAHAGRDRVPRSRSEFEQLLSELPATFVSAFVKRANAARQRCRTEEPRFWLGLHSLYPGIAELLRRHAGRVDVITAKDADSVWSILRANGLASTVGRVYGEVSAKDATMVELCSQRAVNIADTVFIDDNLANAEKVAAAGAQARWAIWGYHTPEDIQRASDGGVQKLTLKDVASVTVP